MSTEFEPDILRLAEREHLTDAAVWLLYQHFRSKIIRKMRRLAAGPQKLHRSPGPEDMEIGLDFPALQKGETMAEPYICCDVQDGEGWVPLLHIEGEDAEHVLRLLPERQRQALAETLLLRSEEDVSQVLREDDPQIRSDRARDLLPIVQWNTRLLCARIRAGITGTDDR